MSITRTPSFSLHQCAVQCVVFASHDYSRSFVILHLNVIHPSYHLFYNKNHIYAFNMCALIQYMHVLVHVCSFAGTFTHQYRQCILDAIESWIDVTVESMCLNLLLSFMNFMMDGYICMEEKLQHL